MKVCFFGIFDPNYARNRVLMEGFRAHGYEIIECRANPRIHTGLQKYVELYRQFRRVRKEQFSFVIVAFPGQTVTWLARLLFGRNIILDAFLSLYDSNVNDRKIHFKGSINAGLDWFWDWSSVRLAHTVLLDTNEHIKYFVETFGVPKEKFIRVWIGADEQVFRPMRVPLEEVFTVHFHGTFIPLQGIYYILDAANLLREKPIRFRIIGNGQEFPDMRERAKRLGLTNVEFLGMRPVQEVAGFIASSHVCLGIFGDTEKTGRVIPNKLFEAIAMGKPVITADTKAVREAFSPGENVIVCKAADGAALAKAIENLREDAPLRERIGHEGRALFLRSFATSPLVGALLPLLNEKR